MFSHRYCSHAPMKTQTLRKNNCDPSNMYSTPSIFCVKLFIPEFINGDEKNNIIVVEMFVLTLGRPFDKHSTGNVETAIILKKFVKLTQGEDGGKLLNVASKDLHTIEDDEFVMLPKVDKSSESAVYYFGVFSSDLKTGNHRNQKTKQKGTQARFQEHQTVFLVDVDDELGRPTDGLESPKSFSTPLCIPQIMAGRPPLLVQYPRYTISVSRINCKAVNLWRESNEYAHIPPDQNSNY
ncbi:hypothetical protein DICVIV_08796 [Dictyocaulus viviparus]|uniref:Uncharacterized protein n=1 Tax=Dictyocaulus viviparus TaxID=29172 RepID=A0A0D8XMX4_DICVI|nr:hypothetical protein DICVIV_08796 [Dictyocaulus viviparus]